MGARPSQLANPAQAVWSNVTKSCYVLHTVRLVQLQALSFLNATCCLTQVLTG